MKIAILASGSGTTAEPFFNKASVVISNNPKAGVIEKAKKFGVPTFEMPRKNYRVYLPNGEVNKDSSKIKYGEALIEVFKQYQVDYIAQAGWSVMTPENVVKEYKGRIVNSHPGPLDPGYPDFGGKGMEGLAVHEAVLSFSKNIRRPFINTEVTLHLVTEEYDKGALITFTQVPIHAGDTAEILQERVKIAERKQWVDFWNEVEKSGEIKTLERSERLIKSQEIKDLEKAREFGKLYLEKQKVV